MSTNPGKGLWEQHLTQNRKPPDVRGSDKRNSTDGHTGQVLP